MQAKQYSEFLRQVPWYKYDFTRDATVLQSEATRAFRDFERRVVLGIEYAAKAQYAKVIAAAVATMEPDALRPRMILTGLSPDDLQDTGDVTIIAKRNEGTEFDVPRYRALTDLLSRMAQAVADFVEIAGNNDILCSATSENLDLDRALYGVARQGYGDIRHLILLPVAVLAAALRKMQEIFSAGAYS